MLSFFTFLSFYLFITAYFKYQFFFLFLQFFDFHHTNFSFLARSTVFRVLYLYKLIVILIICIKDIFRICKAFHVLFMFFKTQSYLLQLYLLPPLSIVEDKKRFQDSLFKFTPIFLGTRFKSIQKWSFEIFNCNVVIDSFVRFMFMVNAKTLLHAWMVGLALLHFSYL